MAILEQFDYEKLMRNAHGDVYLARNRMINSLKIYLPNRSNYIARRRCRSAISIIRRLNYTISKVEPTTK